jgi:tRNA threonylcarbamoyladenosine biosynthesis protein TsaE
MTIKLKVFSTEETERIGKELGNIFEERGITRAFVAMRGEMGVGKTAFTRGFASCFGIGAVKSPTYTILNEYRGNTRIHHFDFYRIESEDDLYSIGYDDYIERDGYSIVEWSENIEDMIPSDALTVTILRCVGGESEREICIDMGEKHENISI